jgi:tetratricopeptide (TPR) repeat protein
MKPRFYLFSVTAIALLWLVSRGIIYHKQGNYSVAIADYERALTKDNNYWIAINNIGFIKYEMGKVEEAMNLWQKAIAINNQFAEPQLALAVAFYAKGEQEQGLEMATKALELDRNLSDLDYLKQNLWGDRLIADTEKLFVNFSDR